MTTITPPPGSSLIPGLRYKDAFSAIRFLEQAFGFVRHAVYTADDGSVQHAELRHGTGMIMLGSAGSAGQNDPWTCVPADAEGKVTSTMYLVVEDCVPIWASAKAAGAEVTLELQSMSYGGRMFSVRDPEGYLWSVGEYSPWSAR